MIIDRTKNAVRLAALTLTLALGVAASSASAVVVYDSGSFSSFTPGSNLESNAGWTKSSNLLPASAVVNATAGTGGGQGVRVTAASLTTDTQWKTAQPVTPVSPTSSVVNVNFDMKVYDTNVVGLTFGPSFGIEMFDASTGPRKQIGGLSVDASNGEILVLDDIDLGPAGLAYYPLLTPAFVTLGTYNSFQISANYDTLTYSVFLNGNFLEEIDFVDETAEEFTDAPITTRFISNVGEFALNSGSADFDNYVISSVPEPTMIGGIAVFALSLVRRRR